MKVSAVPAAGLKRKAPTTKGKGVASDDPGRLQHGKARRTPEGMTPKPSARQCNAGAEVKDGAGTAKGGTPAEDGKGKGKGKRKSDIDDIFAGVKRLKEQKAEEEAQRWVTEDRGRLLSTVACRMIGADNHKGVAWVVLMPSHAIARLSRGGIVVVRSGRKVVQASISACRRADTP